MLFCSPRLTEASRTLLFFDRMIKCCFLLLLTPCDSIIIHTELALLSLLQNTQTDTVTSPPATPGGGAFLGRSSPPGSWQPFPATSLSPHEGTWPLWKFIPGRADAETSVVSPLLCMD